MQATRQLLRAGSSQVAASGQAIPAPNFFRPASEAPSPNGHLLVGTAVGIVFALTYKVYYWNWKKELNQFNYDYDRTMAEIGPVSEPSMTMDQMRESASEY